MFAPAGTLAPGAAGAVPSRTCPVTVLSSYFWRMTKAVKTPTISTVIINRTTNSFVERAHWKFIRCPPA
jgi:hypothetical protein